MNIENNLLAKILKKAVELEATDIHLCAGTKPMLRIDCGLTKIDEYEITKYKEIEDIIDEILDDEKKQILKKDKVIDLSFSFAGVGRFRTNIYSQRGTYAIAIRVLPFDVPELHSLNLPESIYNITKKTKGLVLFTGVTGTGKSTTLASIVDYLNKQYNYHIVTIEDPIEYLHKHENSLVTQREIGDDTPNFADALRMALREDPDVIMLGEMRDYETISIALTAAETGHLVLSTLHTGGVIKTIDRIIDAFPSNQHDQVKTQLATVLECVVSQQLLPNQKEKGLVVATEVMFSNSAIRNLIREGKHYQINSILQTGQSEGMHLMESDLARLVDEGYITQEQAFLKARDTRLLTQFLNRR